MESPSFAISCVAGVGRRLADRPGVSEMNKGGGAKRAA